MECGYPTTERTLRSTMVSQSIPSSSRMASPCSLNSGERPAARGRTVLDITVGRDLRVDRRGLESVLDHAPLPREVSQPLAPLADGALGERHLQQRLRVQRVLHQVVVAVE